MVDVNVDFILGQEEPIEAEFVYEPDIVWDADLELTSPVRKHDQLENRDLPNQHPMSAITGLESVLDSLGSDISEETQARIEADSTLQTAINNEIVRATSVEGSLQTAIDNEEIARTSADTRLEGLIEAEETRAKGVEEQLSDDIEAENTRAINAEETLQDNIDAEEDRAKLAEQGLGESISSEANTRASEITRVEGLISAEQSARISADNTLQGNIDAEELARQNADNALQLSINDVSDDLSDEVTARENADTTLQGLITAEENRAKGVEQQLASSIDSNHQAISSHVSDKNNPHEVTKAQIGLGNVDNTSDLNKPISTATQTALDGKVDKVSVANKVYGTDSDGTQTTYDVGSFGQVDDVQVGGVSVVTNKIAELGTMAGETASNYSTTAQADLRYATASQGALADTALQPNDNITELTNNAGFITIESVPTAVSQLTNDSNYQTGTQVANSIATETTNRENADNNLQSQIDAIVSSSDVFDIVGTYAELQAYDISTVPVNDIIKVLVDSTHGGAATYYRCVETGGVKSWSYIGSEGAYYTKGEADGLFVPQTRTVNNKALSDNITLTASDVGALPSSTVIPVVNDSTVNIQTNGSTIGTFTLNQSSNETVNIPVPTKTSDITNDSGYITSEDLPTNYVTINTAQDIDSVKTFLGEKAILFKQKATTNKLGFTLYNPTGTELGAFEWRPNTISGGALLNINVPYTSSNYVGFRYWGTAVNIIAPKVGTAGNYYIPVNITDGTNTVTANAQGTVNLSTILATKQDVISDLNTIRSGASLGASALQPNDNITELTNNAGYITGITSSDVTSALGYTPYNSTNPSGYQANIIETVKVNGTALTPTNKAVDITVPSAVTEATVSGWGFTKNVGTVTSVNNTQPDANGNVTLSIPTVNNATLTITQGGVSKGTFTANASSDVTIALDSGNNIFVATYGTTTYSDIVTAYNAGKQVICSDSGIIYYLRYVSASEAIFFSVNRTGLYMAYVTSSNVWSAENTDIPTKTSDLNNDSGFITSSALSGYATETWVGNQGYAVASNLARVATTGAYSDLSGIPTVDQTYDGTSTSPQSGTAVAEAITNAFDALYPVGSRYITENSTCPLATLIPGSTWVLTSQGRVIQGADSNHGAGTTANAGLPNITGSFNPRPLSSTGSGAIQSADGDLFKLYQKYQGTSNAITLATGTAAIDRVYFDASKSNSIYGNSTTVQPPAEFVNIFKRTA